MALAVGYDAKGLRELFSFDFSKIDDRGGPFGLGVIANYFRHGIARGRALSAWIEDLLENAPTRGKTPRHFGLDPTGAWLLAAIAGASLALDSPPQAVTIAEAYATLAGTAIGACTILLVVAPIAAHANADWQRLGLRIVGSWMAASAILVLAVQLRLTGS